MADFSSQKLPTSERAQQQPQQPMAAQQAPAPQQQQMQPMSVSGFQPPQVQQGISALVFGASGITGYALMSALLTYPSPQTFVRIIGLTNRPLSHDISRLPDDDRIEIFSGMDLLNREQSLAQLRAIPGIELVTHVYFASYAGHGSSFKELRQTNDLLLTNAVGGVEMCCPNLQFFTLQTGGKAYGVEFLDHKEVSYNPPHHESTPRIPAPLDQNIFYYSQYDILSRASANKPWSFCEIRPDAIIGFVPQNNAMNLAQALALFLSLWRDLEIENETPRAVPFPGSREAWTALHNDTSQDILARFHVFASFKGSAVKGEAFNVADGPAITWEMLWPRLCDYFGLRGLGPQEGGSAAGGSNAQLWMEAHEREWAAWVKKFGLKEGALQATSWQFMQQILSIPIRRDYDLSKSRSIGFTIERPHEEGYFRCFDEMRKAKIIP